MYGQLVSPRFVTDKKQIDDKFASILSMTENLNLDANNKEAKLELLFWCCTYGLNAISESLDPNNSKLENQVFIKKLTQASNSSNTKQHLPSTRILDVYGPYCMIEETQDRQLHTELLELD
ncbi:hypothetical protein NBRC116583_34430 [Arenicella sp. 4NH20-0111]